MKNRKNAAKKFLIAYGTYKVIKWSMLLLASIATGVLMLIERIEYKQKAPLIVPCDITIPAGSEVTITDLAHLERTYDAWLMDVYWQDGTPDNMLGFSNDLQSVTFGSDKTGIAIVRIAAAGCTAGHETADVVVNVRSNS